MVSQIRAKVSFGVQQAVQRHRFLPRSIFTAGGVRFRDGAYLIPKENFRKNISILLIFYRQFNQDVPSFRGPRCVYHQHRCSCFLLGWIKYFSNGCFSHHKIWPSLLKFVLKFSLRMDEGVFIPKRPESGKQIFIKSFTPWLTARSTADMLRHHERLLAHGTVSTPVASIIRSIHPPEQRVEKRLVKYWVVWCPSEAKF